MNSHTIRFRLNNNYIPEGYFPNIRVLTRRKNKKDNTCILNHQEMQQMMETKNKIDKYYDMKKWDKVKKDTNPYEMIYITNKKNRWSSVSKYEPLSRSYFKMVEIAQEFFEDILGKEQSITTVSLAEGPGGFIEGLVNLRQRPDDKLYGITLVSDNREVPGWRRSWYFLSNNQNVNIVTGIDGKGDLYNLDNHTYMENRVGSEKADIVTGDGGFDFSIDYNQQEFLAQKLIFSQMIMAVSLQKMGGSFVCKFFDSYTIITNQIIFILLCLYRNVTIFKPYTSRPANSEKYIVCQGFKGISGFNLMLLKNVLRMWNSINNRTTFKSIIGFMPKEFMKQMREINLFIQNEQTKYIMETINIIENPRDKDKKREGIIRQIKNAEEWCKKYNVPYRNIKVNKYI